MADNEDDSGSTRTITAADPPGATAQPRDVAPALPGTHCAQHVASESVRSGNIVPAACCGAPPADFLQSCAEEQSLLVGTEVSPGPGPDLVNTTTIIYVQPDGSLVESFGLTPEEQQVLLEQLTKQQVIQVSDNEAAHLLQQSPHVRTVPVHGPALDPNQLQQVINQVTRSQQQVHVPQQYQKQPQKLVQVVHTSQKTGAETGVLAVGPGPTDGPVGSKTQNASQQLKSVAQQVAMQTGSSVLKKTEPVRIQIQVPKQEVKPNPAPQQKTLAVSQPQVKLSANGSVSSAQVIHIQPMVGQQGQIFLQQSPGDPPIQLLLQSPSPAGSLLPLVQKLTSSIPAPKVAVSPLRLQIPTSIKTPPPVIAKPVPLLKTTANGAAPTCPSPVKPAAIIAQATPSNTPVNTVTTPPNDKEKEKKAKKRERKAVKVLTRSGRVSRPPKYKAKDYKFIKTEDLADSHQSDSDDYSDMSVEEEESGKKDGSSPSITYSHKSRSFRCQSCDKAYIGPGGLNRHYKLNPTHGDPELPKNTEPQQADNSQSQETMAAVANREEEEAEKPVTTTTHKVEGGPAAAVGLRGLHHRGPGRPRGRGRGRGRGRDRSLGPPPRVAVGIAGRRGRRGRPPKLGVTVVTVEQQAERRRARLQELVDQCEDEDLMDIVLPRLNKVLSLWELLLAKVERSVPTRTRFPDIYREFESLQTQVRQAAQEYILSPQGGATPLEVHNIEVARCLGILDEVNRMKVLPGASPISSLTNKNVRYMENSKMLPPSKRFKMENSVPVHQNGIDTARAAPPSTPSTPSSLSLKSCSVTVPPLASPSGPRLTSTDSVSSSSSPTLAPPLLTSMDGIPIQNQNQVDWPLQTSTQGGDLLEGQTQVLNTSDITAQMKELEKALDSSPENASIPVTGSTNAQGSRSSQTPEPNSINSPEPEIPMDTNKPETSSTDKPETCSTQRFMHRDPVPSEISSTGPCETKEVQEGQEIYIQTEGLTVQLAEPGSDRIVIVNGPDGTTMHIQTPEGVPLEAVQALLGIEASDGVRTPQ